MTTAAPGRYPPDPYALADAAPPSPAGVQSMSISFAGHNIKMSLTYLDADGEPGSTLTKKDQQVLGKLMASATPGDKPAGAAA